MADAHTSISGGKTGNRNFQEDSDSEGNVTRWIPIRFFELFFISVCLALLMALYVTSPIHDDYTIYTTEESDAGRDSDNGTANCRTTTRPPSTDRHWRKDVSNATPVTMATSSVPTECVTNQTIAPTVETLQLKLTYIIILFGLAVTILQVLALDVVSRFLNEPVNKLPMILLLLFSEVFSLILMVLSIDIYLSGIRGIVISVTVFSMFLCVCFASDIICTSVKGNG